MAHKSRFVDFFEKVSGKLIGENAGNDNDCSLDRFSISKNHYYFLKSKILIEV